MPIFDGGGFEAWIEVDGERLEEFDVGEYENEQGVPVMACWVPCVSGKVRPLSLLNALPMNL